ncbi:MAG: hypothetical protein FJ088_08720 [Deltaproteobacteria bacterium]|nr:hypothetical protein [Deltaproteobacteria bacterium]
MKIDDSQLKFMYLLKEGREKGEYRPLNIIKMRFRDEGIDCRVVAIGLENLNFVECVVDERLSGDGKYKYKLTAKGYEIIQDILKTPTSKFTHVKK